MKWQFKTSFFKSFALEISNHYIVISTNFCRYNYAKISNLRPL